MTSKDHYNKEYFDWQKSVGQFGGQANKIKFNELISKNQKGFGFWLWWRIYIIFL